MIKVLLILLLTGAFFCPMDDEPAYKGFLDKANCSVIQGWAADAKRPSTPIHVRIFVDGEIYAAMLANQERPDVADFLGDDGQHGFVFVTPYEWKDGKERKVTVKFESTDSQLNHSGLSLKCGK